MPQTLVIVESPAKARTIEKYLGKGYTVESSIGHIRDLPKRAADIPERYKGEPWARLGLNIEKDFEPLYVVAAEKKAHVSKLKKLVQQADELILATDDDREGESIAWHLFEELKPKIPVRRMVFHEITKEAIQEALANPRDIDTHLVEAQEARRALDRIYGYEVSPVLWKKVAPRLSAGRVQSVATRMLVQRERERMRFISAQWWDMTAEFLTPSGETFSAKLLEVAGQKIATSKDFDASGNLTDKTRLLLDEPHTHRLADALLRGKTRVLSAQEKPSVRKPPPPFITSTLQQEGSRKLGFAATRTMRAAQKLYEGGYITYMRTDSTNLSTEATSAARQQVMQMYGKEYLPTEPRIFSKKAKNAQEAHEAIRPAGKVFRTPQSLSDELGGDEWRLYDLIWKRTVACQMADAKIRSLSVRLQSETTEGELILGCSGRTIDFAGFLRAYVEGSDDPAAALEDREHPLPPLSEGDSDLQTKTATPESHDTQPPARYTEASLVQTLEGQGIGRPSTYASILGTIQDRGYAIKRGQTLMPTWTAFATSALLEQHFAQLVDYNFTARMEEDLDEIAGGRQQRVPYLERFYLGRGGEGVALKPTIEQEMGKIDARLLATIPIPRLEGSGIEVRVGKYGAYLQRGEQQATLPEEISPDDLTLEHAEELLNRPSGDRALGEHEGQPVTAKNGRYGAYLTLGEPPVRTASLFPSDDIATISLERALQLLSLPRLVGVLNDEEVWAHNGKYGPYLKRGNDSRTLGEHEALFHVTLPEAEALFNQPRFRGAKVAAAPLQTFSYEGRPNILLKDGRFGPYLTDGTRNASLRKNESPQTLTAERALEILEERGKEPKKKSNRSKETPKTTQKATKKSAEKSKASKPKATKPTTTTKKSTAAALGWTELKPFLDVLDDTERALLTATRDEGQKVDAAAAALGLDLNKARGMVLQASKKLHAAARARKK